MTDKEILLALRDVEAELQVISGALEGEGQDFYGEEIDKQLAILTPLIAALEANPPLAEVEASLWHDYKRVYHLDMDYQIELPSYTKQQIRVTVTIRKKP